MASKSLRAYSAIIAGVDEAGRGPLAGPVVAAAVLLKSNVKIHNLKDSKKLSPKQRQTVFLQIIKNSAAVGIGMVSHKLIDKINIHRATLMAMREAVEKLSKKPKKILVDGRFKIPGLKIKQEAMIKGDSLHPAISAASIVAKVTRDSLMEKFQELYPVYEFKKHKGYGTKLHLKMIKKHGPCPIHRRSFSPLANQ